jgi:hypothetical protein
MVAHCLDEKKKEKKGNKKRKGGKKDGREMRPSEKRGRKVE